MHLGGDGGSDVYIFFGGVAALTTVFYSPYYYFYLTRRTQIQQAFSYLTSEAVSNKKVHFIVETQLLLRPYATTVTPTYPPSLLSQRFSYP
jgi:hypothetical protein